MHLLLLLLPLTYINGVVTTACSLSGGGVKVVTCLLGGNWAAGSQVKLEYHAVAPQLAANNNPVVYPNTATASVPGGPSSSITVSTTVTPPPVSTLDVCLRPMRMEDNES